MSARIHIINRISSTISIQIFNCTRLNNNVFLDDPLDIAYLHRLAREEPFNYIFFALQPDGLQGYVEAMNVFN